MWLGDGYHIGRGNLYNAHYADTSVIDQTQILELKDPVTSSTTMFSLAELMCLLANKNHNVNEFVRVNGNYAGYEWE